MLEEIKKIFVVIENGDDLEERSMVDVINKFSEVNEKIVLIESRKR